ncbi:Dinucleoside triphosphate hydrolase [Sorochytrium milnesiophthora]
MPKLFQFGQYPISVREVFLTSPLSFAIVNYKPILPGHVLVSPRRVVKRFSELRPDELTDLWTCAQTVGSVVERAFKAESLTYAMQDGAAAGQTVAHVHIHIIPRIQGDLKRNDDIYPLIEKHDARHNDRKETESDKSLQHGVDNEERPPRSLDEMAKEAAWLRTFFTQYEDLSDGQ